MTNISLRWQTWFWGSGPILWYLLVDVVESRLHKTTCPKWKEVICNSIRISSILSHFNNFRGWNGSKWPDNKVLGYISNWCQYDRTKKINMKRSKFSPHCSLDYARTDGALSAQHPTQCDCPRWLCVFDAFIYARAIIRLRAPCPNNWPGCALMSPYTPNQPSRLIVAEMAVDSSDLHRPVCWAGLLPKGSAKQMQTLQKKVFKRASWQGINAGI